MEKCVKKPSLGIQRFREKERLVSINCPRNFRKGKNREPNLLLNISQKLEKLCIKAS